MRRELDEYFAGRRHALRAGARLGADRRRSRAACCARPRRSPTAAYLTYGEVAAEAGSPRGSRAAGNALGANPIPIVIPCHRVLRSGGALGGYGGGLERKRFLLELEGALTPGSCDSLARRLRPRLRQRRRAAPTAPRPRSPSGIPSGVGTSGVSRRYHSASSAA